MEPFTFEDYSARPVHSFPVDQIAGFVSSIYGTIGTLSPTDPILLTSTVEPGDNDNGYFTASNPTAEQIYQELIGLAPARGEGNATNGGRPASPTCMPAPASAFAQLRYFHAPLPDLSYRPTGDPHPRLPPGVDRAQQLSRRPPALPPGLRSDGDPSAGPARRQHHGAGDPHLVLGPRLVEHRCLAVDGGHAGPDQLPTDPAGTRLPQRDARAERRHPLLGHRPGHRPGRRSPRLAERGPPDRASTRSWSETLLQLSRVRAGHDGAHRPRPAIGRPAGHLDRLRHGGRRRLRRSPRRAEDAGDQPDRLARLARPPPICRSSMPSSSSGATASTSTRPRRPSPPGRSLAAATAGTPSGRPVRSHRSRPRRRGHHEPGSESEDGDRRAASRRPLRPREHCPLARVGPVRAAARASDRPVHQHDRSQPAERPPGTVYDRAEPHLSSPPSSVRPGRA